MAPVGERIMRCCSHAGAAIQEYCGMIDVMTDSRERCFQEVDNFQVLFFLIEYVMLLQWPRTRTDPNPIDPSSKNYPFKRIRDKIEAEHMPLK